MLSQRDQSDCNQFIQLNKALLDQQIAELLTIIKKANLFDACDHHITTLKDSFSNLHIYLEHFSDNIATASPEELYRFQSQLRQDTVDMYHLKNIFYKNKMSADALKLLSDIKNSYTVFKSYLLKQISLTFKKNNVNEFNLFEKMEADAIAILNNTSKQARANSMTLAMSVIHLKEILKD